MSQPWLHNNRRLLVPLGIPSVLLTLAGLGCLAGGFYAGRLWFAVGAGLLAGGLALLGLAWVYLRKPRLAYDSGHLLVHLGWSQTVAVPIELVECFFMGQAPSMVRGADGKEAETATVVVRFAERAGVWRSREIPPHLGQWVDGYLIVRGTWCEPINMDLLQRLNGNLAEAHRQQKATARA